MIQLCNDTMLGEEDTVRMEKENESGSRYSKRSANRYAICNWGNGR